MADLVICVAEETQVAVTALMLKSMTGVSTLMVNAPVFRLENGAELLRQVLANNKRLRTILLNGNQDDEHVVELCAEILEHRTLQKFGAVNWPLTSAIVFAAMLADNKMLTELKLVHCGIVNTKSLAAALRTNKKLRALDLEGNEIEDASPLFEALAVNQTVAALDLSHNKLTSVRALGTALAANRALEIIDLSWNQLTNIAAVEDALRHNNKTLKSLHIGRNRIEHWFRLPKRLHVSGEDDQDVLD
jgi:Leucine-rich repeat (LRR) protein